ncbi:hypothetical protein SAMN04488564_11192 [Lentzea waywayandensis]|uniref:Uncharacterized protein n=1 Tax=Lentzea waywayandensis TaxID=84724 RepID=A0A1I6FCG1_9PSEU|nr:hypothetical protein [Lentzea waywayandensis]SFR27533.1 hypothetical protein SAMN04488564_11192 [Lentzea waywayandensis]
MSNLEESVRQRLGWRAALVVAAVIVGTFPWNAAPSSLFGVVPIFIWCFLAGSRKAGVTVGSILLALLVWFVVPRGLGWSGPLVPSEVEVYWLYPMIAAVVCLPALRRVWTGVLGLVTMIMAGFLAAAVVLIGQLEAKPGDEGVLPGPAGLRMAEGSGHCGSGNCSREVIATGDRAPDVMREHLESRGFTVRTPARLCRATGLVFTHEVCVEPKKISSDAVEVTWYVN